MAKVRKVIRNINRPEAGRRHVYIRLRGTSSDQCIDVFIDIVQSLLANRDQR